MNVIYRMYVGIDMSEWYATRPREGSALWLPNCVAYPSPAGFDFNENRNRRAVPTVRVVGLLARSPLCRNLLVHRMGS